MVTYCLVVCIMRLNHLACINVQTCHKWGQVWYQNNFPSFFFLGKFSITHCSFGDMSLEKSFLKFWDTRYMRLIPVSKKKKNKQTNKQTIFWTSFLSGGSITKIYRHRISSGVNYCEIRQGFSFIIILFSKSPLEIEFQIHLMRMHLD